MVRNCNLNLLPFSIGPISNVQRNISFDCTIYGSCTFGVDILFHIQYICNFHLVKCSRNIPSHCTIYLFCRLVIHILYPIQYIFNVNFVMQQGNMFALSFLYVYGIYLVPYLVHLQYNFGYTILRKYAILFIYSRYLICLILYLYIGVQSTSLCCRFVTNNVREGYTTCTLKT